MCLYLRNIANPLLLYRPMYTDVALKVLSEAGSLRSACELDGEGRDLVMTNRVPRLYSLARTVKTFSLTSKSLAQAYSTVIEPSYAVKRRNG